MTEKKKTEHDDSADLRKRAEEELRESEERYRRLVETAPEVIYNLSAEDGTITFLNPAFESITGWSRAEWLGKSFMALVHPDDLTLAMETFQHISLGEPTPPYELRILSKSGEYLIGEFTSFPHIEKGKVIGEFGIARDITERKKAEKEIQDLAKFPSENPNPVLRIARDGLLLYVNAAGLRQLAELHPQVGQAAPPRLREVVFRVMENGSAQKLDLEHRERMYSFSVEPVVDSGYANLYGLDITERMRAEEALRESKEKLRVMFEQLPIGVSLLDQNRKMIYANPALEKILDISRDDLLKGKFQNRRYIRPDGTSMPPEEYASVRAFQEQQPVHDVETGVITESGKTIWTSVSAAPFPVAGKGVVIATVDITDRKRSEDALRESEEKYRSLASTADSMYLVDRECRYIFMNEGHLSRFGLSWDEVIGRSYGEFHSEEDTRHFAENVERVFETGQSFQTGHKSQRDNKYFLRTYSPVIDSKGSAFAVTVVSKDITESKRAEEEIRKKNAELEAFVHMVSHDLKNPVVSIQGFCSLLMKNHKEDLNEKALFYIQRMQANAGLMTDLLEDLVELSRIGRIEDKKAEVSVQEVIKSVWAEASTSLAAQNVEFVSPENLPRIWYSEKRLYQIFYNLLSNALKFRDEKRKTKVEIGHQEDKDHHLFFVRDNGISIEPKYHHKIFESFSQLKDIKVEGTGMGLAIVKKIVEANQGKVWVDSRKGAGSTFSFTIPKNVKF